jgi:hypothetical protein
VVCIVILVGYERDRHLYGIKELSKLGIDSIYILYDTAHEEFRKIVEPNAVYIRDSASYFFKAYLRECDPTNITSIVRELTYISKKEHPSELFIDVTNFTKESYLSSFIFAILFGARLYYVAPEKYEPINQRIESVFAELRNDSDIIDKFKEIVGKQRNRIEENLNNFLKIIEKKYMEKVKARYRRRPPSSVKMVSLAIKGLIKLTDKHEQILRTLLEKGAMKTIAQLTQDLGMKGKRDMAKVSYRVRQLEKWGFVTISKTKEKAISLSAFGKGYSLGICDFDKRKSKLK